MKSHGFTFFLVFSCLLSTSIFSQSYVDTTKLNVDTGILCDSIAPIVYEALEAGAFPGCQILIAQNDEILYHESFGYHSYDSLIVSSVDDIYDLASITKVAGATLALMKLYDDGLLDLDQTLGYYFPYFKKSDKEDLSIRKLLAHQSRMKSWIPFYKECQKKNGKYKARTLSPTFSRKYPFQIPGSSLYMHKDFYRKQLLKMIKSSPLYLEEGYVYSGLFFYLIPELVHQLSGIPYKEYLNNHFYQPLQLQTLGFNPMDNCFDLERIIPSERDTFFRMNTLHGVVHDEGAAFMLGVSGNAGLFGNAECLARLFQVLLNDGEYEGKRYLKESTVREFTRYQYPDLGNRRGLGFDKPLLEYNDVKSSVAKGASGNSYGHTGFTGTLVWADPDYDLIYVFLSNRTYPTRNNKLIYKLNIRPRIHNLLYGLFVNE